MKILLTNGKKLNIDEKGALELVYELSDCRIFQFKNDMYLSITRTNDFEYCKDLPF